MGLLDNVKLRVRKASPQARSALVSDYSVKHPRQVHLHGSYTNYAAALRAMNHLNSIPEYRAYIR